MQPSSPYRVDGEDKRLKIKGRKEVTQDKLRKEWKDGGWFVSYSDILQMQDLRGGYRVQEPQRNHQQQGSN